jgi:radical SAM protein with 4Fe4S-binding SPASM domain
MSEITSFYTQKTRQKLSEIVPLDTPLRLQVDPTDRCNFKCVYCAHSLSKQEQEAGGWCGQGDMSMETFQLIIEQMREFPHQVKRFYPTKSGEPLLNKNLPEAIRLVKETGAAKDVLVVSNGFLLTHEMSDALIDAGLDHLRISLQGLSAEKYKEICGVKIDYERFYENLRYYFEHKKNGTTLDIKIMDVALEEGEREKFFQMYDGISDRMNVEVCHNYSNLPFTKNLGTDLVDRFGVEHPRRTVCPLPFMMLSVDINGDVYACYQKFILGNIHSESLRDIFNGEKMRELQKMQLQGGRFCHEMCGECVYPNDDVPEQDVLDDAAEEILARLKG